MARIFITGSSDGLGSLAAQKLIADLAHKDEVLRLAEEVNQLGNLDPSGKFDAIIHNAGIYEGPRPLLFAVNTLAPYLLTTLIHKPSRLIYLSSGLYTGGKARLDDLDTNTSYSDSKFHIMLLTKAVARRWPTVYANAINPGWVPTKMGGRNAPDSLEDGYIPQTRLAVSEESDAKVTGQYFSQGKRARCLPAVDDVELQDDFIARMEAISGIPFG